MAVIAFPTTPGPRDVVPRLLDFGAEQKPALGGATTRVERIGSRFAIDVTMPPLASGTDGRLWAARLMRGKMSGQVSFLWPQPSLPVVGNAAGTVFAAAAAGATSVVCGGASATQGFVEGQFVSFTHGGRRYLHAIAADAVAVAGQVTLSIVPRLRVPLAVADVVTFLNPVIEGRLVGEETGWTVEVAHLHGLTFTVEEIE